MIFAELRHKKTRQKFFAMSNDLIFEIFNENKTI